MRRLARLILAPAALAAVIASGTTSPTAAQTPAAADTDDTRVPGDAWTVAKPESVGYSSTRLESLRSWLNTLDTKAMLIAVHGQVIFAYGDLAHASKVASVRKSVLSMLYGRTSSRAGSICGRLSWRWASRRPTRFCRSNGTRRSRTC